MSETDNLLRARQQLADSLDYVERLRLELHKSDLSNDEVERALQPALSFHTELQANLAVLEEP